MSLKKKYQMTRESKYSFYLRGKKKINILTWSTYSQYRLHDVIYYYKKHVALTNAKEN